MMTSGAAPMMTPTLAGSAARVAWIISTLHPASPMAANAASHAHSRPAGRGSGLRCSRAQAAGGSAGRHVADCLAAEDRVATEKAGGGHGPADQQYRPGGQPGAGALALVQSAHAEQPRPRRGLAEVV